MNVRISIAPRPSIFGRRDASVPKRVASHALPPAGIDYSSYKTLEGTRVLITGSARGIGLASAKNLASLKATVIIADVSDTAEAEAAIKEVVPSAHVIRAPQLNLGSFSSISSFADWIDQQPEPVNILINNAGANFMGIDPWFEEKHGFAGLPMVNFAGPMTLTRRIIPKLIEASTPQRRSRIVNVCSIMHRFTRLPEDPELFLKDWWLGGSYRNCKLALTQSSLLLQAKHGSDGIDIVSVDPGAVYSNIWATSKILGRPPMSNILSALFSTPDDACASTVHATALPSSSDSEEVVKPAGYYARGLFANSLLCNGLVPEPLAGILSVTDWPLRSLSLGYFASRVQDVPVAPHALDLQATRRIFDYLESNVWSKM
jgi:NAD(P)-dependent dehydrogenase (short-subunit alcohol dehydrogenase family)